MAEITVFGQPDARALAQLERCAEKGNFAVLCADNHVGYSQPIGGAIAYEHFISPSGVGYDIGCIAEGSRVSTAHGFNLPIENVSAETAALCFHDGVVRAIERHCGAISRSVRAVRRVELSNGRALSLTGDHRVLTKRGWIEADHLTLEDRVACVPFIGLPYEPYPDFPIALVRLLGYVNGDGHLSKDGKRVSIYTTSQVDAASLSQEAEMLGYRPRIYTRLRVPHRPPEIHLAVGSKDFHERLAALGAPVGKKVWSLDQLDWLFDAPAWVRAQYLSSFASAEMATPRLLNGQATSLALKQAGENGNAAAVVALLFESLGFDVSVAPSGRRYGDRLVYVIQMRGGQCEQLRFFENVGFCHARGKRVAAATVASVLWQRQSLVERREFARDEARRLHAEGRSLADITAAVGGSHGVAPGFVRHAIYAGRGKPRRGLGVVLEPDTVGEAAFVRVVDTRSHGDAAVWDLVTGDPAQSFQANGIVVHNCGNKAARTPLRADDVDVARMMDEITRQISFGVGRTSGWHVEDPVLDRIEHAPFAPQRKLGKLAREQLGTVGGGNHYVDLFSDDEDLLWVGVHFGSRGFGHKTATGFLALAQGKDFGDPASEGSMDAPPVLLDTRSELGQAYVEAMTLAGEYAYAGRDLVVERVLKILGTHATEEVHNHHNFAWREPHFGRDYWVVRKGCTPAFPGQRGFVGGSMGDSSVILEGFDGDEARAALYSTVHGAGRVMSRRQAAGKRRWMKDRKTGRRYAKTISPGMIDWEAARRELSSRGIELRGGGADEAPGVYKRLQDVLDAHAGSIRILHTLRPLGVAMASDDILDPYRD